MKAHRPSLPPIFKAYKLNRLSTSSPSPPPNISTPETTPSSAYPSSNPSFTHQIPISPKRSPKHSIFHLNPFRIRASSTPQWSWSNKECKAWLVAVLVEYCGRDEEGARGTAETVFATGGFGPSLYLMTSETWMRYLGQRDGNLVYSLLLACKNKRGAVPRNVRLTG